MEKDQSLKELGVAKKSLKHISDKQVTYVKDVENHSSHVSLKDKVTKLENLATNVMTQLGRTVSLRKHQEILVDIENSLVEVNEALNQAQKSLEDKKNGIDKSEEAL